MKTVVHLDKEYDDATMYQKMKDEAEQIEMNYQRQKQVRQLFYQQAGVNRLKVLGFDFAPDSIDRFDQSF